MAGVEGVEPSQTEPESVVLTIILHPSTLTPCCVPRKPCVFRISSASEYITDSLLIRQALFHLFLKIFFIHPAVLRPSRHPLREIARQDGKLHTRRQTIRPQPAAAETMRCALSLSAPCLATHNANAWLQEPSCARQEAGGTACDRFERCGKRVDCAVENAQDVEFLGTAHARKPLQSDA